MSNYMGSKLWDEITYPFPNFNGATIGVWEWVSYFISHIIMDVITYSSWDLSYKIYYIFFQNWYTESDITGF